MRTNLTYILLVFYLFCNQLSIAQDFDKTSVPSQKAKKKPVLKISKDTLIDFKKRNHIILKKDSIANDTIKPKEVIDGIITHNAKDYTIQNAKNKTVTLYNEAEVLYTDIDLKAGIIVLDYKNNTVYAKGIKDSLGYHQRPVFKQAGQESEQDSILFNFKTKKALVYGVKTDQRWNYNLCRKNKTSK